jgi:hypothetical protein
VKFSREAMPLKAISAPFNYVASSIPIWRTVRLLRWMQNYVGQCSSYADRLSTEEQLLIKPFFEKPKIRTLSAVQSYNVY